MSGDGGPVFGVMSVCMFVYGAGENTGYVACVSGCEGKGGYVCKCVGNQAVL